MADKSDFEDQLDQIRVNMYERTKKLSSREAADALNRQGREVAEKFGIIVTKASPAPQRAQGQAAV